MDPQLKADLDRWLSVEATSPMTAASSPHSRDPTVSKFIQTCAQFNPLASSNLLENLLQHRENNQTFDLTENYSFLNETKVGSDKHLEICAPGGKANRAFRPSELVPLDSQKTGKFLDAQLHSYYKKLNSKITLKGNRLSLVMANVKPESGGP